MNFYQHAGRILDKLARHEGTIKGLVIGDPKVWDKKKMYALVCETLKCKIQDILYLFIDQKPTKKNIINLDKQVLNELIDASKICEVEKKVSKIIRQL